MFRKILKRILAMDSAVILLTFYIFAICTAILIFLFNIKYLGDNHIGLRNSIAEDLLDSADMGLSRYFQIHHKYPDQNGKYFYNSIREYVDIREINIYTDSVHIKPNNRDSLIIKHFIGIGSRGCFISYRKKDNTYLLYYIGENGIDEYGNGDDIVQ